MPVPLNSLPCSARVKTSKILSACSGSMPMPLSSTEIRHHGVGSSLTSSSSSADTTISGARFGARYFAAFSRRFWMT